MATQVSGALLGSTLHRHEAIDREQEQYVRSISDLDYTLANELILGDERVDEHHMAVLCSTWRPADPAYHGRYPILLMHRQELSKLAMSTAAQ